MDPQSLIGPVGQSPYPAPFWFMELFKVLGFSLHVVPMNLWYAGTIIAVVLGAFGVGHSRTVGHHIARTLPFALAFGINFGIVPLLFIQTAYYQFFYPATILMAWPWFAVFWLVTIAYLGVYLYRLAIYDKGPVKLGRMTGWVSAGAFILVGFIFANALSLMTNVSGWWNVFSGAEVAGAATGAALNTADPTLIPRWLFMFGIALTTTAAFVVVDAAFLSDREDEDYGQYAGRFSMILYSVGLLWFVVFGSWYIFGTRPEAFPTALRNPAMMIIFPLTAISPGVPWLLVFLQRGGPTRKLAVWTGVAQFGVIALNAVSRQWLQNVELAQYARLAERATRTQTGALIFFLLLFIVGLGLIAWIISKMVEANRREGSERRVASGELGPS